MPKKADKANSDYVQTLNPQGYVNNREITNLPGHFLVRPSKNCIIVNKEKTASRKGYSLVGDGKTKNKGHRGSFDWETHLNITRSGRMNAAGELEVWFQQEWHNIKTYTPGTRANFWPWWDSAEGIDKMLFVVGTDQVQEWSGGMVEIATTTAVTMTLRGYKASATIGFVENGASPDTITDSTNSFLTYGFRAGDTIIISGSASNDGTYTIASLTSGVITLSADDDLVTEAEGASVIMKIPNATWAEQGFYTTGTRKVTVNGTEYAYTGGETTGTLTGLVGVAGVVAGDIAIQTVRTSSDSVLTGKELSLIAVSNNYVFYGDLKNREVNVSTNTDFMDFSYTTPLRAPGEGFLLTLDRTPTAFVPDEDDFYITGRKDDVYKITFELSADQGTEQLIIKKLKTATGQAAQSQAAVINIKNAVAWISFEPTLDTLQRILLINSPESQPLSYEIKNDFLTYDLTDAHGLYFQNQIFVALPNEGLVLIYDLEQKLWQPPQTMPIGRLALIDVDEDGTQVLCGHSSVSNETYRLFDGYNDNGAPLRVEMWFGYDNYGSRFMQKTADEFATELYMSVNTNVQNRVVYDYKGATEIRNFDIRGDDDTIRFAPNEGGGLGFDPLGQEPLGSLASAIDDLSKYRCVDTTTSLDWFERQRCFIAEGVDIRFAVIAYGENVELSDNIPHYIKR